MNEESKTKLTLQNFSFRCNDGIKPDKNTAVT